MSRLSLDKAAKQKFQQKTASSNEREQSPKPSNLAQALLALQRTAGNQAVTHLLQRTLHNSSPGTPVSEVPSIVMLPENSPYRSSALQIRHHLRSSSLPSATIQQKENHTGLSDPLKARIEQISGLSMDDVHVHYNSSQPAEIESLAYTQGTDIHVGPGQEQHLAHEAWHVVQQKQGRVKPTIQAKGVTMNDDHGLEKEAEEKGKQATRGVNTRGKDVQAAFSGMENKGVIQRFDDAALRKIKAGRKLNIFGYKIYQPNRPDPFIIPDGVDFDVAKDSHHIHLYLGETYECHAKWGDKDKWVIDNLSEADLSEAPKECPKDLVEVLEVLQDIINDKYDEDLVEALQEIEEEEKEKKAEAALAAKSKGKK